MKKIVVKFIILIITIFILWWSYLHIYGNFHKVDNDVFRSGQLYSFNMPYYIKSNHIKTIINLKKKIDTYEQAFVKENNITYIHFVLSDKKNISLKEMKTLSNLIKSAPKPVLIHCFAGADRTSLAVGIYLYDKNNSNYKKAFDFIPYGHFPWFGSPTKAMDESFKKYLKKD